MVSVTEILDRNARNRELRAYAYLQASFVGGSKSAIDCLFPFITTTIALYEGKQFDINEIIRRIEIDYKLPIPYYMVEDMVPKLIEIGAIQENKLSGVSLCAKVATPALNTASNVDFTIDEIDVTEDALAKFAAKKGLEKPAAANSWSDAIVRFFQSENEEHENKVGNIKNVLVANSGHADDRVVSEFVFECSEKALDLFGIIQKIYYGVLVADFLVNLQSVGNKQAYEKLCIIYDTPVLMRLLGTSGKKLQMATQELHTNLRNLGCKTYYFAHSYDEISNNLEAIIQANVHGGPMFVETQAALNSGELSLEKVTLLQHQLAVELTEIGVTEHTVSYVKTPDAYQIDEEDLVKKLMAARLTHKGRETWEKDASSLALTLRLLAGHRTRDISDALFVFVTSNRFLVAFTKKYLRKQRLLGEREVSPMLTVGQMTTVSWMANGVEYETSRLTKALIANCYRASMPMSGWDDAFWLALHGTNSSNVKEKLKNALYIDTTRRIAMEETFGNPALLPKLDLREVLQRAEANANDMVDKARIEGESNGKRFFIEMARERVFRYAACIVRYVEIVVFCILSVAILCSFLEIEFIGFKFAFVSRLIAGSVALITLMDFMKVPGRIHPFVWFEKKLGTGLFSLTQRTFAAISRQ